MANLYIKRYYPECCFGGFTRIDGTVAFFTRVNALLQRDYVVVDVGCGRGEYVEDTNAYRKNLRILKGKVRRVVGIDIDGLVRGGHRRQSLELVSHGQPPACACPRGGPAAPPLPPSPG